MMDTVLFILAPKQQEDGEIYNSKDVIDKITIS
jgi:hypothetical protein